MHPGTREPILEDILSSISLSPLSSYKLLWLYGPPQIGKSTLAVELSKRLDSSGKLAASFFFSPSSPTRNHGNLFITTLAYQLASSFPPTKSLMEEVLSRNPLLMVSYSLEMQAKLLIYEPLVKLQRTLLFPSSVVIDALDVCSPLARIIWRFLQIGISEYLDSFPLRFIIFTRPESWIKNDFLRHFQPISLTRDLSVYKCLNDDIHDYLSSYDSANEVWIKKDFFPKFYRIKRFIDFLREESITGNIDTLPPNEIFATNFSVYKEFLQDFDEAYQMIPVDFPEDKIIDDNLPAFLRVRIQPVFDDQRFKDSIRQLEKSWLPKKAMDSIVYKACGQFAYASSILKYILNPGFLQQHRPKVDIFSVFPPPGARKDLFADLDGCYMSILDSTLVNPRTLCDILGYMLAILDAQSCNRVQLPTLRVIEQLLNMRRSAIYEILAGLHSVIDLPDAESPYTWESHEPRFICKSFVEFLTDISRSEQYHIDLLKYHIEVMSKCMEVVMEPPVEDSHRKQWCMLVGWLYAATSWLKHWGCILKYWNNTKEDPKKIIPSIFSMEMWVDIVLSEKEHLLDDFGNCDLFLKRFDQSMKLPLLGAITTSDEGLLYEGWNIGPLRDASYILNQKINLRIKTSASPEGTRLILGLFLTTGAAFGIRREFFNALIRSSQDAESSVAFDSIVTMMSARHAIDTSSHILTMTPFSCDSSFRARYNLSVQGYEFWIIHFMKHIQELSSDPDLREDCFAFIANMFEDAPGSPYIAEAIVNASNALRAILSLNKHLTGFVAAMIRWFLRTNIADDIMQKWVLFYQNSVAPTKVDELRPRLNNRVIAS
ncbi:hypothetical protein BDQ12DRAFT_735053 [Crucibulum laeve]|uniref:Nephrocystin 3-like N-terminal domain-containing protein n=1 Tax=Crucibulum laeve TaxID=68775 RepID=A0A5C3M377_9AGAR|nr:hypothetical protein BDQ12DRAFT_735053 [Crucibulum laeve]